MAKPDDVVDKLRRARPAQLDPTARRLEASLRSAVAGVDVEPVRVARFVVQERLGAGGMGAVYAAFDPKLDRRVALKLLHAAGERERAALLVEARALARLSHPNVVAVYDADELDGELYIAMELVVGTNLRGWLAAQPRSEREIAAVIAQAARGLAAAHAAGLVHGDVKPENILVGDGVVKVADFGLARADTDDASARGGTPAYLAPEQLAGKPPDARSDQFALAVTLGEAVLGERPAAGATLDGLSPWLARIVAQALRVDPAARHPSVAALADALAPPARRPRTRTIVLGGLGVAAVAVAVTLLLGRGPDDATRCADAAAARIDGALAPEVRAGLAPRIAEVIDRYGNAWTAAASETCLATRRGEQSEAMLELRMSCLERRRDELAAFATVARGPGAIDAAYALSPLEPCADRDRLAGVLPPPVELRATVDALRRRLDGVRVRELTPAFHEALADARAIVDAARLTRYAPLIAEALHMRGVLENRAGDAAGADATLRDAIAEASAGNDDELLAQIWMHRIYVTGIAQDHHQVALAYAEAAQAAAAHTAKRGFTRGMIDTYVGQIQRRTDQLVPARATLDTAVRELEEATGSQHPLVAEALDALADVELAQHDLAAARTAGTHALAIYEATYGPDHPETAIALDVVASIDVAAGDLAAGLAGYREEARRLRARLGDDAVPVAIARANIGQTLRRMGRDADARVELEAARTAWEHTAGLGGADAVNVLSDLAKLEPALDQRAHALEDVLARRIAIFGEMHHAVGDTLVDLGNVARDRGDLDGAIERYQRASHIYQQTLGAGDPRVSVTLSNLGEVALDRRRWDEALVACTNALAIDEPALGADHADLAYDLTCIGQARLGRGDTTAAIGDLERALRLRAATSVDPKDRAVTQFALARALWSAGRDRSRAAALATQAATGAPPPLRDEIARLIVQMK